MKMTDEIRDPEVWNVAPKVEGYVLHCICVSISDAKKDASMGYRFGFHPKIKKFADPTGVLRNGVFGVYLEEEKYPSPVEV